MPKGKIGRPKEFKDRRQISVYLEARVLKRLEVLKRALNRRLRKQATYGDVITSLVTPPSRAVDDDG